MTDSYGSSLNREQRLEPAPCLKLMILEHPSFNTEKSSYSFVIVDTNLGEKYPANFFCVLPLCSNRRYTFQFLKTNFAKKVGKEKALEIAKQLLENALERFKENEPIRTEIEKRFKDVKNLEDKPTERKLCACGRRIQNVKFEKCCYCRMKEGSEQ